MQACFGGDTLYDAWDEVRYLGKRGNQLMLEPPFPAMFNGDGPPPDDLRFMPNVRQLGLYKRSRISAFWRGCPDPLALAENPLRDFSPLSTLTAEFLDLSGTYFVDLPLASCTRIKALRLLNTSVQDLTLKELPWRSCLPTMKPWA